MSARRYSLEGRLGKVIARGGKLAGDVAEAVVSASLSLSASEVTQLELTLTDDDEFSLLRSGLFAPGTPTKAGSRLDYGTLALEVRAVELSARGADHVLKVTARSLGAAKLKRARGELVRKNISPTQFAKLEAAKTGLKFVGEPSAKRKQITRHIGDDAESSWDTLQRLASEIGYLCFEVAGVLYFGRPTWLTQHTAKHRIAWKGARTGDELDALPTCRRSGDDAKNVATVDLALRGDAGDEVLPGMGLILDGVPTFEGLYMIDSVTLPLAEEQPATVAASTPLNPTPQPPPKPAKKDKGGASSSATGTGTAGTVTGTGATGSKSAAAFVGYALAQAGDTYIYGAEAAGSNPNPNAFDCSELVEWAAARAGVTFVDGSANQLARSRRITVEQAIRTKGALLFHPGHVAISLGNGRTIEAANSRVGVVSYSAAGRFSAGGLIPGMRY